MKIHERTERFDPKNAELTEAELGLATGGTYDVVFEEEHGPGQYEFHVYKMPAQPETKPFFEGKIA